MIEFVCGNGLAGDLLLSPPCQSMDAADDLRRALYRSASYYCSCGKPYCTRKNKNYEDGCPAGGMRVSCRADIVKDGEGRLRVQFRLLDKTTGMRYMVATYGADRGAWPYDPRAKKRKG